MSDEPEKPKLIADLTPNEIADEMRLREELRDLAELREMEEKIEYVSRRPDDGRLYVRLKDGEIIYIPAETVDAYLAARKSGE